MDRDDPAWKGQRDYTPRLLNAYDRIVLGIVAKAVWRCPTPRLVDGYRQHIRPRHLDVGPGTGYFIEHSGLADGSPVTILDPNANVLEHAGRASAAVRLSPPSRPMSSSRCRSRGRSIPPPCIS